MSITINSSTFSFARELLSIGSVKKLYLKIDDNSYLVDIEVYGCESISEKNMLVLTEVKSIYVGIVSKVLVAAGDIVEEDQPVILVDTLGLEHEIFAPSKGMVESIDAKIDDFLEYGSSILKLRPTI